MRYLSKKEFESEMKKIQAENLSEERKAILKAEKEKYKSKSKIETHKFIMFYLFALLNIIVIYSMVAMWAFRDLTYLGVLISDIAAQVIVYAIYCLKAYHGKKQEEQMKLEKERLYGTNEDEPVG